MIEKLRELVLKSCFAHLPVSGVTVNFQALFPHREGLSGAFRRSRIVTVDPRETFRLGPRPLVIVPIRNIEITESLLTMISVIR